MPCKEKISKLFSNCNWLSKARKLFVPLVLMQYCILGGVYMEQGMLGWIFAILAFAFVVITWIITYDYYPNYEQLSKVWIVWTIYVFVLVTFITYIFGWVRDKLDKKNFWGPNNLKITLCLTPVIAIVMIATAQDSRKYGDLVHRFYAGLVLELFDAIEALAIVISPQDIGTSSSVTSYQSNSSFNANSTLSFTCSSADSVMLPVGLVVTIIVFAALSLLLSPLEMAEKKLCGRGEHKTRKRLYFCRLVFKKLLMNLALMITRLVAWLAYSHEASIFIIKNAATIVVAAIGIIHWYVPRMENETINV